MPASPLSHSKTSSSTLALAPALNPSPTHQYAKNPCLLQLHHQPITPEELIQQDWSHDTALLVIPGGADKPYLEKLRGPGNAKIKQYVANGGKYLGICAGAYYSADHIEFAKGDQELEVIGDRELKFFPGLVQGPTYSGFDYRAVKAIAGMRAAKVYWQAAKPFNHSQEFVVFYNGGGHFVDAEKYPNVKVLARYASETPKQTQQPAAIVECAVGKGKAILSGPHFEWDPATLEGYDQRLIAIKDNLHAANENRLALAANLLERLEIEVKD